MTDAYARFAKDFPNVIACCDSRGSFTWAQVESLSQQLSASLIRLGLDRDDRVLCQIPSDCREFILRIALKKAGLIGAFAAMQWRERELGYSLSKLAPAAVVMPLRFKGYDAQFTVESVRANAQEVRVWIDVDDTAVPGWFAFKDLLDAPVAATDEQSIVSRQFAFDEVSLVTTSSGTSGYSKLCEWPEAAQLCVGRGIADRLHISPEDRIGIFAPMSGAAGTLLWTVSGTYPCRHVFPSSYEPEALLGLAEKERLTVITTVPVILTRIAQSRPERFQLDALRAIRVGTAAAGKEVMRRVESACGCRVIPASGSMECPGFGHADINEPVDVRLDGSVGLPLPGGRLRIQNDAGKTLPAGEVGELAVSAPFASSGYWEDTEATRNAWKDASCGGWYSTGDLGVLDANGRLTLVGRRNEVINRSGHKILPLEVERALSEHPDILDCAVVGAPDKEYGEVPWAFVQFKKGRRLDPSRLAELLRDRGMATYKLPARFIEVSDFPRVVDSKIDKKRLISDVLDSALQRSE